MTVGVDHRRGVVSSVFESASSRGACAMRPILLV
jgi:hypothetical protein